MRQMRRTMTLMALAAVALLAAACGGKSATIPTIPTVSIGAADYSFALPDSIPGGLTRLQLTNAGKEAHHAQFVRLNSGVTVAQFLAALPQGPSASFPLVAFTGGSGPVGPGGQSEATVELTAGQYALLCFLPSPDGVPHLAKGMVRPLTMTAAPVGRPAEPAVQATVELKDFAFAGVPEIKAGKTTLKVVNGGKEPHEMGVLRAKGVPAAKVLEILSAPPGQAPPPAGPPPFDFVGGFQAVMPGAAGFATVDLTAGEYALICFVPSPVNQGKPHFALGMFSPFTVR